MFGFRAKHPPFQMGKKERGPPSFVVAFQQQSAHCITKLLKGFQNRVSKACRGLARAAASQGRRLGKV